jgi:anti-sigma B factor antagonist
LPKPVTASVFIGNPPVGPVLDIHESVLDGRHTLRLVGEIDLSTSPRLEAAIEPIAAAGAEITLDLREVTFIDSTGLRLLLLQSRRYEQAGIDFQLIPGPPHIQRLFAHDELLKQIVKRIVVEHKAVHGKGPERAQSYLADEVLTVVLEGGFTPAEQALSEAGEDDHVVRLRATIHRTTEANHRAIVEDLLGRSVRACECAVNPSLGLHIETYLLQPLDRPAA